ncbi:MAG: 16S rRNA (cytidine(1402)-2'-O)-methyltransferase [Pseudomonadota bacterium]|nr:16S rRNA (cytidine(1402)-2'-O)-methyltransferase [Pseudomonadota bacterium]
MNEVTESTAKSTLYVVATPIGNLGDLGSRALEVLANVRWIAAEDTRHTGRMLRHFGIATPTVSLHEHNERQRCARILELLANGDAVALVSDAGTPLVSDPGYHLVREIAAAGYGVIPVPGACAAIAALSVSGLPTDRFTFEGFLPARAGPRQARLKALSDESRTLIFYETPRRVLESLNDMIAAFGPARSAYVGRELTKLHETHYRGTLSEIIGRLTEAPDQLRGEFVVCVQGGEAGPSPSTIDADRLLEMLVGELPVGTIAAVMVEAVGGRRNDWYRKALALKEKP